MRNIKQISTIGSISIIFTTLILVSCKPTANTKDDSILLIEATTDSTKFSMPLLMNELGAFNNGKKFVGIIPVKLREGSQEPEIEFYVTENSDLTIEIFVKNIQEGKSSMYSKRKISSVDALSTELNTSNMGIGKFAAASNSNSAKSIKMTLTSGNTTVTCTCPCSIDINGTTASCN